jgi:hypothetical protein
MNLCLLYRFKSGVDFRGRHVELRLTELDYTLLLDTVVPRLMITIESRFGWLAPLWLTKRRIHTQGAHWYDHRSPMAYPLPWSFLFKIKVVILSLIPKPRIHWAHVEVPVTIQSLLIWYRTGRQWFSIFKSCGRFYITHYSLVNRRMLMCVQIWFKYVGSKINRHADY